MRPGGRGAHTAGRLQNPPDSSPRYSPDGRFWWDGVRWVVVSHPVPPPPSSQAPAPYWPPPAPGYGPPPPPGYWAPGPPAPFVWKASPGLRPFLLVVLIIADVVTGLLAISGVLALAQYAGLLGGSSVNGDNGVFVLIAVFELLFGVSLAATVGVIRRSRWARIVTIVAGVLLSLTCLGVVLGIPIIVAGARAPIRKPEPASA